MTIEGGIAITTKPPHPRGRGCRKACQFRGSGSGHGGRGNRGRDSALDLVGWSMQLRITVLVLVL